MVCKVISCNRIEPVIFSLPVNIEDKGHFGTLNILQNQEPADVVYDFCSQHDLFDYKESILRLVCDNIVCKRAEAVIYRTNINDELGQSKGLLIVMEGEEPVDAIYDFAMKANMDHGYMENILNYVCDQIICNRRVARIFHQNIRYDDNGETKVAGVLDIFYGEEPVDVVYKFVKDTNMSDSYIHSLLVNICKIVTCTRTSRSLYSRKITMEGRGQVGYFHVVEGEEPADSAYRFIIKHSLPLHAMDNLLDGACEVVSCLRRRAVKFAINVNLTNGTTAYFEIFSDQEPADAGKIYHLIFYA
jgi:hypothetical protein